jgi:hypothetical protein
MAANRYMRASTFSDRVVKLSSFRRSAVRPSTNAVHTRSAEQLIHRMLPSQRVHGSVDEPVSRLTVVSLSSFGMEVSDEFWNVVVFCSISTSTYVVVLFDTF